MSTTLRALGTAVLLAGLILAPPGIAAAAEPGPADRPDRAEAIARAEQALANRSGLAKSSAQDDYQVRRVVIGSDGSTDVRFDRTYRGLPVLGGDLVVHHDSAGALTGMSMSQDRPVTVDTDPAITAAAARAAAPRHFRGSVDQVGEPRLVVDAGTAGNLPRLAWETVVSGFKPDGQTPSRLHVVTDAEDGALLFRTDEVMAGTGEGVHVGSVEIDTTGSQGSYELTDPERGEGYTCDMNNGRFSCSRMTDEDDRWGDGSPANDQSAAVDAHYGAAVTYDYFKNVHGRDGIFGDGRGVPSRVHYGDEYVNAFWDGRQMTYGDGRNNSNPLTALDVAGHEMAHGVTEALSGLCYDETDCGGLNEATSDIFGTMAEFYAGNSADPGDYEIGEEIDIRGNGTPLRYMYDPTLDGNSFGCYQQGRRADPHYTSGIGNHFFFLLAEGSGQTEYGDSPTCDGSTVTGIGKEKAADIWFKALDEYFVSRTQYPDARADTLAAATELYGECSTEYRGVLAAWNAVDVTGSEQCQGDPTDPAASFSVDCSESEPSCSFDGSGSSDPDGSVVSYAWDFGDGQSGSGVSPSHTYGEAGTYSVVLTVTDDEGNTGRATREVTAGGPPQSGEPPRAEFQVSCQWDSCGFDGTRSTDPDGDIASYSWDFGDGETGSGASASHTYPNRNATYTAELTVTDAAGNSDTASRQVDCWSFGSRAYCFAQ
ncbi:M4 family metallopeptidase [Amycolatopsis aidingensis]|uniref:M4 family metallopeptidase n=1 Tax=Amycolatopsis aidingensis TaxID=2842453 RepID=UPI001C0C4DAF|nr:M4 family metallopeptidase [Amycolatopsis aidingensis]